VFSGLSKAEMNRVNTFLQRNVLDELRTYRTDLPQEEIPTRWYNLLADMPRTFPSYREIETGKEVRSLPETYTRTASQLEFSEERWIPVPDDVLTAYVHCGRPTPLIRAHHLEKFLGTPARIYYKCEDLPPTGTFKMNTAIPQAFWAMKEGYKRTIFAGSVRTRTKFAHAFAAKLFSLKPTIFMTRADCAQNSDQVFLLRSMFEADLYESPTTRTEIGRKLLREDPNDRGSRAITQREVVEETKQSEDGVTVSSSFLNHVLMTQTVIGLEVKKQLDLIGEEPNVLVASVGAGSHLFGLIAPFVEDVVKKRLEVRFLGAESETSSKLTDGTYDYAPPGQTAEGAMDDLLVKTYRLSWETLPVPIKAVGIQTQTTAPLLSLLRHMGLVDTRVYPRDEKAIFEAARIFLQTEGRLLAPESAYAVRAIIDEALEAKKTGREAAMVVSVSGTSFLDFEEKKGYGSPA